MESEDADKKDAQYRVYWFYSPAYDSMPPFPGKYILYYLTVEFFNLKQIAMP